VGPPETCAGGGEEQPTVGSDGERLFEYCDIVIKLMVFMGIGTIWQQ
jgi:hypothetical protein